MTKQKHTERKHALLSASGASRWMNCAPSARLEENFKEQMSIFAEEGTLAHEFADIELRKFNEEITDKVYNSEVRKLRNEALFAADMEDEVDKYVQIVIESFTEAKRLNPHAILMIEQRLDYSHIVSEGFGTGDAIIISDGTIEIIDLKYGKGVKVDADNNPQLLMYALGALRKFDMAYDISNIKVTVVQPRLDHYSSWEISENDINKWAIEKVKPAADLAYIGEGEQQVGDWCKFCKAKSVCRALAEESMKLAAYEFRDPYLLSDAEILKIYGTIPIFAEWVTAVSKYVSQEAISGKVWPGYKLVEGRSNRKFTDEEKVKEVLLKNMFKPKDYLTVKLAGITAIEKLVGRSNFGTMLQDLVVKPPGAPTLVPEGDKRPAFGVEQAKLDFTDIE